MEVGSTQRALAEAFSDHTIELSLSDEARDVLARLDERWLISALKPQILTYPDRTIMLRLFLCDTQPLEDRNTLRDIRPADVVMPEADGILIATPKSGSGDVPQQRFLLLPSRAVMDGDAPFIFVKPDSLKGKAMSQVYRRLYGKMPIALDRYRQSRNSAYDQRWQLTAPTVDSASPLSRTEDGKPWMWIAMHWLENGGAEEWAFRQAELARDAGYRILITVDRGAPQRLLGRAYGIAEEVFLCAQTFGQVERTPFVDKLLRTYQPAAIHIHHSVLAYENLGLVRTLLPDTRIEDSVHIVEHRGGGYVADSVRASRLIDLHHVISPQLREIYTREAGIDQGKVAYYPLTGLTARASASAPAEIAPRPGKKLRVGFLGRMSLQKRPFLFVDVARKLHAAQPEAFEFVMQGSGELASYTRDHLARAGLADVVATREWGPVTDFLSEIDVLLITSDNEGLTLTSLEATGAGVLVVSADVGSQLTVVAPGALLPREPKSFLAHAVALLKRLASDDAERRSLMSRQMSLVADLASRTSAEDFYADHYRTLAGKTTKE
ncbi:hypothetical protein BSZ39_01340 [Bowdeniella nasicola]|uniref:Uncharacterized protein n=1 Tax=Bowdeniella nasicola TaxID=208480 RepID=A0A1Q5Q539_9ACTO|nr:glycosyltransferase [Bowdeniella nasicola]OKL54948.1 hypothetical protein BSZ39_01340 [Bowdeniella nasicola]